MKCRGPTATVVLSVESKKEQPSFEEALTKLESIVESMESGEVPLADLIARFEKKIEAAIARVWGEGSANE